MKTSQRSNQDRPKELQGRPSRTEDTQTLPQLFVRDLAHCPRFDRAAEYTLACQLRSARLQLVTSLKAQHERLVALLGEPSLPSSYDTISEAEILRLLNSVQVCVDRASEQETSRDIMALQNWLARVRRDLRRFHEYRDEMVHRNLRFVVMLARRYQHQGVSLLDLVQEGALGMMRAVEKFDLSRGVRFASYAVWWIREAFARVVASRGEAVCFAAIPYQDEDRDSPVDCIVAPPDNSPEVIALNADMANGLHQALACLPVQEADIIRLRFGLGEGAALTLAQVGKRLGLSRAQVQVREHRGLARLRAYMQHLDAATSPSAPDPRRPWRTAA